MKTCGIWMSFCSAYRASNLQRLCHARCGGACSKMSRHSTPRCRATINLYPSLATLPSKPTILLPKMSDYPLAAGLHGKKLDSNPAFQNWVEWLVNLPHFGRIWVAFTGKEAPGECPALLGRSLEGWATQHVLWHVQGVGSVYPKCLNPMFIDLGYLGVCLKPCSPRFHATENSKQWEHNFGKPGGCNSVHNPLSHFSFLCWLNILV